jgi:hypothetical protein
MKKAQGSVTAAVVLVMISMVLLTIIITIILIRPQLLDLNKPQPQVYQNNIKEDDTSEENKLKCNPPYLKVGYECCLDSNYNYICDRDEAQKQVYEPFLTCESPYIKVGTECCIDDDRNGRCDYDDEENCRERTDADIDSPFYLSDYDIYSDEITLYIKNDGSSAVTIKSIEIDDCDDLSPDYVLEKDKKKRFTFDCDKDYNFDRDITIEYTKSSSNETYTADGYVEFDDNYCNND